MRRPRPCKNRKAGIGRMAPLLCLAALTLVAQFGNASELALLRNGFSISFDHSQAIGSVTRLYLSSDNSNFYDVPTEEITGYEQDLSLPVATGFNSSRPAPAASKSTVPLDEVVNSASAEFHLDPDLVNSVIHAESGFNSHAVSRKGAGGLMQLMPGTASQLGVVDVFDPQANVTGGSRYLRELLERYNFDLVKALAAYNAGPLRVEQYRGVPPYHETRAYVARIVHEYNTKKIAEEKAAKKKQVADKKLSNSPSKPMPKAPSLSRLAAKPAANPNVGTSPD